MAKNIDEIIAKLKPAQQEKINSCAKELITEELTLQELRQARKLTQVRMAKRLNVAQKQISAIEKRTDMHISTLRRAIEAMGGNLLLVATFPDRQPVTLAGIADLNLERSKTRKQAVR